MQVHLYRSELDPEKPYETTKLLGVQLLPHTDRDRWVLGQLVDAGLADGFGRDDSGVTHVELKAQPREEKKFTVETTTETRRPLQFNLMQVLIFILLSGVIGGIIAIGIKQDQLEQREKDFEFEAGMAIRQLKIDLHNHKALHSKPAHKLWWPNELSKSFELRAETEQQNLPKGKR